MDNKNEQQKQEIEQALSRIDLDFKKYGRVNKEDVESILKEIEKHSKFICIFVG